MFNKYEIPVAYSMVELARQSSSVEHQHYHEFICYWTAFNNIYNTLANRQDDVVELISERDGSIRTRQNGSVQIPSVRINFREYQTIMMAFEFFSEELNQELITHSSTEFFVNRVPMWGDRNIEFDASGQRVNGVINVGYTVREEYPVWSPIDIPAYERFVQGVPNEGDVDLLAKQILFLIYSVRNNFIHAGKRADDATDREVVENAIPLLSI